MITLQFIGRFPEQDRLEDFASDVMNHFFPRDLKKNVLVGIQIEKNLEENDAGTCVDFGVEAGQRMIHVNLSRRFIDEEENFAYTAKEIATTLAHELVHVKQNLKGELNNKLLSATLKPGITEDYYCRMPWEAEAFDLQDFLVDLYW